MVYTGTCVSMPIVGCFFSSQPLHRTVTMQLILPYTFESESIDETVEIDLNLHLKYDLSITFLTYK